LNDLKVFAGRAPGSIHAILCGACGGRIAEAPDGILSFPRDSDPEWNGWVRSLGWSPDSPGGLWEAAPKHLDKQLALTDLLEVLPAIIECPACEAGDLFDPEQLTLRPNQLVARAHHLARLNQV